MALLSLGIKMFMFAYSVFDKSHDKLIVSCGAPKDVDMPYF